MFHRKKLRKAKKTRRNCEKQIKKMCNKKNLEKPKKKVNAGLVKFDLLGLKTLTVIDRTIKRLKLKNINLDISQFHLHFNLHQKF